MWNVKEDMWTYIDQIKRVNTVHKRTEGNKPQNFVLLTIHYRNDNLLPLEIEQNITKEEMIHTIYLLNDEGKTIECIN